MKKLATALLSTALAVSTLSMGLVANAAELSEVGRIGEKGLPDRFTDMATDVSNKYKEAFQWATTLHALDSNDKFDFGTASGEFLHRWSGTDLSENAYEICNQDFDNGNSTASGAFTYNNWAAIVCWDETTLNVVVLRDAAAEYYAKGGGVNNLEYGQPTTNQYWRMEDGTEVLYQQFQNGYLRIEEGKSYFAKFHNYIAEGDAYVEPPAAPPAYGDIYALNEDGCTWEQPRFVPGHPYYGHDDVVPPYQNNSATPGDTDRTQSQILDPSVPTVPGETESTPVPGTSSTASGTSSVVSGTSSTVSGTSSVANNNQTASGESNTTGGTTTQRQLNVGATVGIVVACVVVVGGGAFCLYWFVLRKKKAAADGADDVAETTDAAQTEEKSDDKPEDKK